MQKEATDLLCEFVVTRSPEVREKLVLESVPLVHYLLARMGISRENGMDYEDLAHQGLIGLIDAVDHFDPDFRAQFSTYASVRIRGKILDYLRTSDRMSRAARKRLRQMQDAVAALWSELLREPTEEELAAYLGVTVKEIREIASDSNRTLVSLDWIMDDDKREGGPYRGAYRDGKQENPSDLVERTCLIEDMTSAIQSLSEREQLVLSLYYNDELTFKEIGKVLGITESRVCQMHASAILNLKAIIRDEQ